MSQAIFIHSLFRSGSTYLFNVFRRADDHYYCFQEPFHEELIKLNTAPETLLDFDKEAQIGLRHPELKKPYFHEFTEIQESLQGLFYEDFSYEDYFIEAEAPEFEAQARYIEALINNARSRPVIQFCRSSGRVKLLKESFPGLHIHLWREPRNQWWSYNINNYFHSATQRIYASNNLPYELDRIKKIVEVDKPFFREYRYPRNDFDRIPLNFRTNYMLFYALWFYSFTKCEEQANLSINIDKLYLDATYRDNIKKVLKKHNIDNVDFDDCNSPFYLFSENENHEFSKIENEVNSLFLSSGYKDSDVDFSFESNSEIRKQYEKYQMQHDLFNDAVKTRSTYISYLDSSSNALEKILARELNERLLSEERARLSEQERLAMLRSRSWRITKPLRDLSSIQKQLWLNIRYSLTLAPDSVTRNLFLTFLMAVKRFVVNYPFLKNFLLKILMRSPTAASWLFNFLGKENDFSVPPDYPASKDDLSPRAKEIHVQLIKNLRQQEFN